MVVRQPLLQRRWQQQLLVGFVGKVGFAHQRLPATGLGPSYPQALANRVFSDGLLERDVGSPSPRLSPVTGKGASIPVDASHPVQQLLDRVNRFLTRGELWRATEIYLNLWGSAFWALERDERGQPPNNWEIWPLRPDRVRILPDKQKYVKGYVYFGMMGKVAYTPEEIIWIRYFNPLEEYAGLSPMAPSGYRRTWGSTP